MAQWQELCRLDAAFQAEVSRLYEKRFPRHIRHHLSVWIENQDWYSASLNEQKARTCFNSLLVYLAEEWRGHIRDNNILQGPDLIGIKDYIMNTFENQPKNLAAILFECLAEEKKILHSAQGTRPIPLDIQITELKMFLEVINGIMKRLHENSNSNHGEQQHPQDVGEHPNFIVQTKQSVLKQIHSVLETAKDVVERLTLVELPEWKRRQQMACIGKPVDTSLDQLQNWFTNVTEVLQQIKRHLSKLLNPEVNNNGPVHPVAELNTFTQSLLTHIVSNALVVEQQPVMSNMPSIEQPLIIKTKGRFTVKLRFLVNLPEFQYRLKVKPVFDKDVAEKNTLKGFRRFNFKDDLSKVVDLNTAGDGLVAEFDMIIQESQKRALGSNESCLSVPEELHVIKFVTEYQRVQIEASSLPVVVISGDSQFASAWASVLWYNYSNSGPMALSFFCNPPPLPWWELADILSWQFLSIGKRPLDKKQLSMLRGKFVEDADGFVHWKTFSLSPRKTSVWFWLAGILDLIKKHLLELWRNGLIMGFVSRKELMNLLKDKKTGTFLLRFSETNQDGAISFSWVEHKNGEAEVHSIKPYKKVELETTPLPDLIYNYGIQIQGCVTKNPLLYLYPDKDRDTAFGAYYTPSETQQPGTGYLGRKLIPVTNMPTPPPSPPPDRAMVDVPPSMDNMPGAHSSRMELLNDMFFSVLPEEFVGDFISP
ncbi:signal transducer and activator of transcription 1-alpha/beta-like [Corythoichthys intestinalis]|uniref:signal transducer and activator of transcription 1-alpha/beta-like n=1 Tax=Corythoichthys intestinalis TaxID=161448 RepID=UPI0025A5DA9B|nr:signal transducer and activator of transcription 1-alpha/beta-like [Corythoichthys intestinalis]